MVYCRPPCEVLSGIILPYLVPLVRGNQAMVWERSLCVRQAAIQYRVPKVSVQRVPRGYLLAMDLRSLHVSEMSRLAAKPFPCRPNFSSTASCFAVAGDRQGMVKGLANLKPLEVMGMRRVGLLARGILTPCGRFQSQYCFNQRPDAHWGEQDSVSRLLRKCCVFVARVGMGTFAPKSTYPL